MVAEKLSREFQEKNMLQLLEQQSQTNFLNQ